MSEDSTPTPDAAAPEELDVRGMRKPLKHPAIFARFAQLPVGGSFVLINDHDPQHLHDEFERDHRGAYDWTYLNREMRDWQIRISRTAATPQPRLLADTTTLASSPAPDEPDAADGSGAVWRLDVAERDLDSNVIALPPGGGIDAHTGPDLDVLIHVITGSGRLIGENAAVDLHPGVLLWLPRRSRRQFAAGPDGLRYLTVHRRRPALSVGAAEPR